MVLAAEGQCKITFPRVLLGNCSPQVVDTSNYNTSSEFQMANPSLGDMLYGFRTLLLKVHMHGTIREDWRLRFIAHCARKLLAIRVS